jgi:hypothetical protein
MGFEDLGKPRVAPKVRIQKAISVMKSRGVQDDRCPRCKVFDWNVDLLEIPVKSAMAQVFDMPNYYANMPVWQRATGALSVISMVCKNCGYTMLHNLTVLEG